MKSRTLTGITSMTLLAALGVAVRLEAQDQQQHYTISDLGSAAQATSAVEPASDSVVPRLIQFSGTVKDAEGKPATGSVELTFSLYQFHEGGSPLWVETQTAHLDSQGRYTVLLGAASPNGLPLDVFANGAARWLGVEAALPGVGEQPRVLLAGVPYALKAADAETLGGKPASAYVTTETLGAPGGAAPARATSTSAGVQTLSPTLATGRVRKEASSTGPLTACSNVTADGTATANFVAKFTSPCVIHQSAMFESGGKVGIGTKSPGAALDVSAPASVLGIGLTAPSSTFGAEMHFQTTGSLAQGWQILDTGQTASQGSRKLNIRNLNDGADVLTIDAFNDSVGIGTVNPSAPLTAVLNKSNVKAAVIGVDTATIGGYGVVGETSSTGPTFVSGVGGFATAASGLTYGVNGTNRSLSDFAAGVEGDEFATSGKTFGTIGTSASPNGTGIYGLALGPSKTASGLGCCPVGVWGDTGSNAPGAAGLVGTADDGRAIYLQNNSPSGVPTAFMFQSANGQLALQAGGSGGFCTVDSTGHLNCANGVSVLAAVDTGQRQVALYAVESPQNWFEDFGTGRLASGGANVSLDGTFSQTVDAASDYHVFLTPEGDCRGLYVSHKTATGFEVHELGGGQSNVSFDYRIVALRRGFEKVRMEDMTEPWKKLSTPLPKVVPAPRPTRPAPTTAPSVQVTSNIATPARLSAQR